MMKRWILIGVDLEEKADCAGSFLAWLRIGCKVSTNDRFVVYEAHEPGRLVMPLEVEKRRHFQNLSFGKR